MKNNLTADEWLLLEKQLTGRLTYAESIQFGSVVDKVVDTGNEIRQQRGQREVKDWRSERDLFENK